MKRKFFHIFVACLLASLSSHLAYSQNKPEVVGAPFMFDALGTSVNLKCKLKTLTVGAVTVDSPTASFRAPDSGLDEAPFDGLLGNDFFKD